MCGFRTSPRAKCFRFSPGLFSAENAEFLFYPFCMCHLLPSNQNRWRRHTDNAMGYSRTRGIWRYYQSLLPWRTSMRLSFQHHRSNVIRSSQRMENEGKWRINGQHFLAKFKTMCLAEHITCTNSNGQTVCLFRWNPQVENECGEIPTVVVQNKIDLLDQAIVTP